MDNGSTVWILALVTFGLVLAVAFWQRARVEKAKKNHEHSAMTAGKPELRRTDGAPGVDPQ